MLKSVLNKAKQVVSDTVNKPQRLLEGDRVSLGLETDVQVIIDSMTGVNYLVVMNQSNGGCHAIVMVDENGKPLVTPVESDVATG